MKKIMGIGKDFFDTYYSSNIMHLILFINNDIDKRVLNDKTYIRYVDTII